MLQPIYPSVLPVQRRAAEELRGVHLADRHTRTALQVVELGSVQCSKSIPVNPKLSERETKVAECEMKICVGSG